MTSGNDGYKSSKQNTLHPTIMHSWCAYILLAAVMAPSCRSDRYESPFGCDSISTSSSMTDDKRKTALDTFNNDVRFKVANGEVQANTGAASKINLPQAQNMYKLVLSFARELIFVGTDYTCFCEAVFKPAWKIIAAPKKLIKSFLTIAIWNCTLENIAASMVLNCPQGADPNVKPETAYGWLKYDNTAAKALATKDPLVDMMEKWIATIGAATKWAQKNAYDADAQTAIPDYANMINANQTAVGCAQAICGDVAGQNHVAAAACVYDQKALVVGDIIYQSGQLCTNGGPCSTYPGSSCDTSGLCIRDAATTTESTSTTTASMTTNAHPNPSINQICPANANMNDRIRTKAVDMHNYRRSQLALGKVAKNNGRLLPSASNMIKLKYDCELEKSAKAQSDTCSTVDSPSMNAFSISSNRASTRVLAIAEAIKNWWKQVRLVAGIGMAVTFKQHHANAPIRTFTKMAWANTRTIGCGVTRCGSNFVAVCQYNPGGNNVNEVVYNKGTPCSNCPSGSVCYTPLCVFN